MYTGHGVGWGGGGGRIMKHRSTYVENGVEEKTFHSQ